MDKHKTKTLNITAHTKVQKRCADAISNLRHGQ